MAELTEAGKQELAAKKQKLSREEMQARRKRFLERKNAMAQREDTVVVRAASMDIRSIASALNVGDVAFQKLRNGMGIRYSMELASEKIHRFNEAAKEIIEAIEDTCKAVDINFKAPSWVKK